MNTKWKGETGLLLSASNEVGDGVFIGMNKCATSNVSQREEERKEKREK
jgi:hypothetical protein